MNCDRRRTRRWSCTLYLQKLRDLAARRLLLLTWGVSGSNCNRSGLVWPQCSEVLCCFVWLSRQVGGGSNGQCQLQFVSPPLPTPPASSFCLETTCLPSIDAGLLASTVSNISHNNLWSSGVKSHWSHLNGKHCVWKKTTVLLIVTRSCGHLEKLSIWPIIILLLPAWSHASSDHMFLAVSLAEWMSVLKSLFLARGWVEEKFMRWPHRRQNNYTPLSSLIWSWDQHLVSRKRTQTLEEMIHGGASDQKLQFKQNHKFLGGQAKVLQKGGNTMTRCPIMSTIWPTWLIRPHCSSLGSFW